MAEASVVPTTETAQVWARAVTIVLLPMERPVSNWCTVPGNGAPPRRSTASWAAEGGQGSPAVHYRSPAWTLVDMDLTGEDLADVILYEWAT